MKKITIFLFVFFVSLASIGQIQRGLIVELDTQLILIGDQINMTLEMRSASSDRVTFPNLGDTLTKNVEIVTRELPDTSFLNGNKDQLVIKQHLTLTSFDTGVYKINPISGTINGDSAFTQAFMIGVYTFPIDSTNAITDIKGNITDPLTFMDYAKAYWHYAGAIWAFWVILFLIWYYFSRIKKKAKEEVISTPSIPTHDLAMQRLLNLEEKKLWQGGKFKDYHVRLSEIVREYLENRYNILALEQTTEEILADLKPVRMDQEIRANLNDLLQLMDLVKFAKMQPLDSENLAVMKWSKQLIDSTKLVENEKAKEDSE